MNGTRRHHLDIVRTIAVALPLSALALTGCATGSPDQSAPPGDDPVVTDEPSEPTEPTGPATSTPAPTPADTVTAMLYFPLDTRAGFRLGREPREVPDAPTMAGVVEAMIAGPVDPDYQTVWNPATTVHSVTVADGVVTVDLSADARTANVGSALAALMVDQLVYTVTDAARDPSLGVLLTIDGAPAGELWGVLIWDAPVTRGDPMSARLLVGIDNLAEGAAVTSPVVVSGEANVFEATLQWQVLDGNGAVVQSGSTMTSEGQTFAPYSFELTLPPGTYTVVVTEDDPSDGAGGVPMSDSRTITVG